MVLYGQCYHCQSIRSEFYSICGHYSDIIMSVMASQITSVSIVCSTVCSGVDQIKHQSSALLAFVRGIHQWPGDFPHKGPITPTMFLFDAVSMMSQLSLPHQFYSHDDVIKWKHFPRNWPILRGIHWSPVNSPHKGQWRGAFMFFFICFWINDWVNNPEAGDLRRSRAHYDIIVMYLLGCTFL